MRQGNGDQIIDDGIGLDPSPPQVLEVFWMVQDGIIVVLWNQKHIAGSHPNGGIHPLGSESEALKEFPGIQKTLTASRSVDSFHLKSLGGMLDQLKEEAAHNPLDARLEVMQ
jgi:hypothetical protein